MVQYSKVRQNSHIVKAILSYIYMKQQKIFYNRDDKSPAIEETI